MNIIVCAKYCLDVSEIKIDPSTKKPVLQGIPKIISDIDKSAVEEAIRIKEKWGGKVTAVTIGPPEAKEKVKPLLAMGADEAVLIAKPDKEDYYITARLLSGAIKKIGIYDIILCGEASIDLFSGQIGPQIAGCLEIPQITYAQAIAAEEKKATVERNLSDMIVVTESPYPVLISVTKEINKPRLPNLMQIMQSAKKPIHEWTIESLGIDDLSPKVEVVAIEGVPMERKNMILEGSIEETSAQLAATLSKEGLF